MKRTAAMEKLRTSIVKIEAIRSEMGRLKTASEAVRQTIIKGFGIVGIDRMQAEADNGDTLTATVYDIVKLSYQFDKLKAKFGKHVAKQMSDRVVTIPQDTLLALARVHPDVRASLSISYTPSEDKIQKMYENGSISVQDLKGCYTLKTTKGLRITRKKK